MTGAIVVSWGTAVRGRETKGLEVFMKALGYWEELAKTGRIHGHREYIALTGNTSERNGFMLIEGEVEELQRIQTEEATQRLIAEASAIVDNFTVQFYVGGSEQAVQEAIATRVGALQGLGYM